jgi:acyl dehydratase
MSEVIVGFELPEIKVTFKRADLIQYAGASGDFNIIHWNERTALSVGLPGVIAHGMLTMGQAINVITRWVGSPANILDYTVRFTRPVVVPDDDAGVEVTFNAKVSQLNEDGTAKIDINAVFDGKTVLGKASAIVRI